MSQHSMSAEELQSKVISFLRFPLIVAVVLIHVDMDNIIGADLNGSYQIFRNIDYFLSQIFAAIAVPLFFFFSGFLFFYKKTEFTRHIYYDKIKKRSRTLLIPYIFWNILFVLVYFIGDKLVPGAGDLNISEWNFEKYILSLWAISEGHPANFPLWFLRDLMVVMVFSPIVYLLISRLKKFGVWLLALLWFFVMKDFTISLFFFSFGAYFSISQKNFVTSMKPYLKPSLLIYLILSVIILIFKDNILLSKYLIKLSIPVGIVLVVGISSFLLRSGKCKVNEYLGTANFFIYAYHAIFLLLVSVLEKITFRYVPINDLSLFLVYISKLLIIVVVGLFVYHFLHRFFPKLTALITGGR